MVGIPSYLALKSLMTLCPRVPIPSTSAERKGKANQRVGGFHGKSLRYIFTSGAIKAVGVPLVCSFVRSFARSSINSLPHGVRSGPRSSGYDPYCRIFFESI